MLRRTVRLRKEYLYRKSLEEKEQALAERKRRLKDAIESGKPVPSDLKGAVSQKLLPTLDIDDERTQELPTHIDDEYAFAGIQDPKVVLTTSRNPSSRLQLFVKELRLLVPGCQRINRGGYVLTDLVELCRGNDVTDLVVVHEHRGQPDGLLVCHLPHGPTASFSLSGVVLRHDLHEKPPNMSEALPHLIFHNFTSKIGARVCNILKHIFPPAGPLSQRVHAFVNIGDCIHFRHYTWEDKRKKNKMQAATVDQVIEGAGEGAKKGLELVEVGPRFSLKPFKIELGTVDMKDIESEWCLRPYFNRPSTVLA